MDGVLLGDPFVIWECPNCNVRERTERTVPNRYHQCAGLRGLLAPLVPEGTRAKTEAVDREDYVDDEMVQTDDDGRPIMAVHTTSDAGDHRIVFAPTARLAREEID